MFNAKTDTQSLIDWIKNYFIKNGPDCNAVIGISGGKDSSVVAALCVAALGKDRVIGVQMPQNEQHDINVADDIISFLGIKSFKINIGKTCDALYDAIGWADCQGDRQVTSNTPARIRMATLYAISAMVHGRVANTCNRSEDYVGYATKFGDGAGDFSPLSELTVREVIAIGRELGLPEKFLTKVPEDGLSGLTDEQNLGFSYDILDSFLLEGKIPDYDIYRNIQKRHEQNVHKISKMPAFMSKGEYRW